jgi:hypothetical protein
LTIQQPKQQTVWIEIENIARKQKKARERWKGKLPCLLELFFCLNATTTLQTSLTFHENENNENNNSIRRSRERSKKKCK